MARDQVARDRAESFHNSLSEQVSDLREAVFGREYRNTQNAADFGPNKIEIIESTIQAHAHDIYKRLCALEQKPNAFPPIAKFTIPADISFYDEESGKSYTLAEMQAMAANMAGVSETSRGATQTQRVCKRPEAVFGCESKLREINIALSQLLELHERLYRGDVIVEGVDEAANAGAPAPVARDRNGTALFEGDTLFHIAMGQRIVLRHADSNGVLICAFDTGNEMQFMSHDVILYRRKGVE